MNRENPEYNLISRGEFLKKLGKAAIALELSRLGVFSKEVYPAEERENEKLKEYNRLKENLERQLDLFVEQKTTLTPEEITNELARCKFLEGENIPISELKVSEPWKPFTKRDVLKESIEAATKAGELSLNKDRLNIVQVDFTKIGALFYGAMYLPEYRTIFINQKDPKEKRQELSKLMYKSAISEEYQRQRNLIDESNLPEFEKERERAALREWHSAAMEKAGELNDIPRDLLLEHREIIETTSNEHRMAEAMNYVITKTNIQHEAFHHFYENMLEKEGYEGPSIDEILAIALRGKRKRVGLKSPVYEIDLESELELQKVNIEDERELLDFCQRIAKKYSLTSPPRLYTEEEWQSLPRDQKKEHWTHKTLSRFLDEYIARIYNGALGNTPEKVSQMLEAEVPKLRGQTLKLILEDMYHVPAEEELKMLQTMKWNGKPIL